MGKSKTNSTKESEAQGSRKVLVGWWEEKKQEEDRGNESRIKREETDRQAGETKKENKSNTAEHHKSFSPTLA